MEATRRESTKDVIAAIKEVEPKECWQELISSAKQPFKIVKSLEHLEGKSMYDYLIDSVFLYYYALYNRITIMNCVLDVLNRPILRDELHTVHNYVNHWDFIIRKGAISSYKDARMLIPFNMEDGTLICEGKSNAEWNFSAPHGAGRLMSRSYAKKNADVEAAEQSLKEKDIYASVVPPDEVKEAYKNPAIIEEAIGPTAKIIGRVRPWMTIKAKDAKQR